MDTVPRPSGVADDAAAAALPPPRHGFATVLMVVASVIMSFGGLIVRNIEAADPWQINLYRASGLVLAIGIILVCQYRAATMSRIRQIGPYGLLAGVLLAAAGLAILQSITHTTVANTLFTLSAIPFVTAGLAWLVLGEKPRPATLVTMVVAAGGIFVMVAEGIGAGSPFGNGMALVTAVCFSGFAVIVRRHREVDMLPTILISGVIIVVICFALRYDDLAVSTHDFVLSFFWGSVMTGVANWFFIVASRHMVAAEVTLFMLLEFALGPIWVWWFVNEVPSRWTLVGGTLVIAAVAIRAVIQLRRSGPPSTSR